jgi:hypothetical protein
MREPLHASRYFRMLLFPVILVGLWFSGIHLEEHILRRRAEHLFVDIRSLQVRRTGFSQASHVFSRWERFGVESAPCNSDYCNFRIVIQDFIGTPSLRMDRLYHLAGGRMSGATASIMVRSGVVWHTAFELGTDDLSARLYTIPRLEPTSRSEIRYAGPDACLGCIAIRVAYTPYAAPEDVERIGRINFSCITAWLPCRTKAEIMPGVMIPQVNLSFKTSYNLQLCSAQDVRNISRDADDVAIADVLANWKVPGPAAGVGETTTLRVHLLEFLKGSNYLKRGSTANLGVVEPTTIDPVRDVSRLAPKSQVIIVFDRNLHPSKDVNIMEEPCGVIPLTATNLALVQSGIQQDDLVHLPGNPGSAWTLSTLLVAPDVRYRF